MSAVPDREARLAFVREFAQTSPYYQTLGMHGWFGRADEVAGQARTA